MKPSFFRILFFLTVFQANAQERFGNEWINFNQKYLKFTVSADAVYKVSGAELVAAGWNLSDIKPSKLQLFQYGQEVSIYVSTNSTNFSATDFIEFYGEINKGKMDSLLYRPTTVRANPYYSFFTDKSNYYLTIGTNDGKRMTTQVSNNSSVTPEAFHLENQKIINSSDYTFNSLMFMVPFVQQSYFEVGEGNTGKQLSADTVSNHYFSFINRVQTPDFSPEINLRINGRSRVSHSLTMQFLNDTKSAAFPLNPYGTKDIYKKLAESMIVNEKTKVSFTTAQSVPLDWYSVTYIIGSYPQKIIFNGLNEKYFYLKKNANNTSVLKIDDADANTLCYNITKPKDIVRISPSSNLTFDISQTAIASTVFAVKSLKKVSNISEVKFIDYSKIPSNYLIITDTSLSTSAKKYAEYRATSSGGGFNPLIVYSPDLYDQFLGGDPSPIAISRFSDLMLSKQKDLHLLLIGKTRTFPYELRSTILPNLVPSFGYPASDILLTAGLNGRNADVPAIPTGRLSVTKNEEVLTYLAKVQEFETPTADNAWKKEVLHLNGGHDSTEIAYLADLLKSKSNFVESADFDGKITAMSKISNLSTEKVDITKNVNNGVSFITYAGHGSATDLDFDIGLVSQNPFNNKGKYPLMYFDGCGVGNCFYKYDPLSVDWLLAANKGSIAILANSYWSFGFSTDQYLKLMYKYFFYDSSTYQMTLGQIQQKTVEGMVPSSSDDYMRSQMQQVILLGDPALKIFPLKYPDFNVKAENSIFVRGLNATKTIEKNDSLIINVLAGNYGLVVLNQKIPVTVNVLKNKAVAKKYTFTLDKITTTDTLEFNIANLATMDGIQIIFNEDGKITEYTQLNNSATLNITNTSDFQKSTVYPFGIYIDNIAPEIQLTVDNRILKNGDYVSKNPIFDIILQDNIKLDLNSLTVMFTKCPGCALVKLDSTEYTRKLNSNQELEIIYQPKNLVAGKYNIQISGQDASGNKIAIPYLISFVVTDSMEPTKLSVFPIPATNYVQFQYSIVSPEAPNKAKITIYNLNGQVVNEFEGIPNVGLNIYEFAKGNLADGTYYVKFEIADKLVEIKKIIFR